VTGISANIVLKKDYNAVVVGSGPNGLAAAITLAEAGQKVLVIEARESPGGGTRTAELTLPGFRHDICAAVHPLGFASPFFRRLDLQKYGLDWVHSPAALGHPFDDGSSILVRKSLADTASCLGADRSSYLRFFTPFVRDRKKILADLLGPLPLPPRYPIADLRFGLPSLMPATLLARMLFKTEKARGLFAGMAAHSILPLEKPVTSAFALAMHLMAHSGGWPLVRGGTSRITTALLAHLKSLGGEIVTGWRIQSLDELPSARTIMLNLTPRQVIKIAGDRLPSGYRRRLEKYRYGPGVFKVDWALDAPVPWQAVEINQAATVHLGGTLEEISASERSVWQGSIPERPYVILSQPTLFDSSRAPSGKHTVWAYCHVPHGSNEDMTALIEAQVERYAPGFSDRILARSVMNAAQMEAYNPNYVGGDINSGAQDLAQFFTRPVPSLRPYATPLKGIYLCSSSTPPGGGVHGLCGWHAAQAALRG
jgi:phytoene dehydrogenase-like protein